jgi:hypothetical protein
MERLEVSVACRNYYGEDLAQLRTRQGANRNPGIWPDPLGNYKSHRSLEQYERGLVGR